MDPQSRSATDFTFLSEECVGSKLTTPISNGAILIIWQDNNFYSVPFRDQNLKKLGITGAEKVLAAVKEFVENGEVWV